VLYSFAKMADPFEVRLRFTNLLSHLSASSTASLKCAHYALKYRDMDEDLHSCILENLERNNINNRANIMYFLGVFCEMALKEGYRNWVEMIARDMSRIVNAVAVSGANVKVVRRVTTEMGSKGALKIEVVERIEEKLKGIEEKATGRFLEEEQESEMPDALGDGEDGAEGIVRPDSQSQSQRVTPRTNQGLKQHPKVDKRVIEQRIEEDRERNKRLRESVWAVSGDDGEELEKMWEEGSDVGVDDYILAEEEAEERKQFARYHEVQVVV
jgi:CTD kinase subunit gamma